MTIHASILDDATTIDPDHAAKVRALIHATQPDADELCAALGVDS